jgi:hypothetical protein
MRIGSGVIRNRGAIAGARAVCVADGESRPDQSYPGERRFTFAGFCSKGVVEQHGIF